MHISVLALPNGYLFEYSLSLRGQAQPAIVHEWFRRLPDGRYKQQLANGQIIFLAALTVRRTVLIEALKALYEARGIDSVQFVHTENQIKAVYEQLNTVRLYEINTCIY